VTIKIVLAALLILVVAVVLIGFLVPITVGGQDGAAKPGSPAYTESLSSTALPPPLPKFGGEIKQTAAQSTPWWPSTIMPPKGAPNVLLIMLDDAGYGSEGTFGGTIPTPALDRIAKAGLRYTAFHSAALCSPTRAALITGRNHHSVHFGIVAEGATGYPGYDTIVKKDSGTLKVDGKVVDAKRIPKTLPFLFPEDETFDVGVDTRTPIDDRDYQVPFRFQGKLVKMTVQLHPLRGTLAQIIDFKWRTRD
jgi:Sulfatase